jgi:L-alanine-DL-glutamate epimerase-like enolase superfamily enzyme
MQIAHVEAIPVHIPKRRPTTSSLGTMTESQYGVVIVRSDEGHTGIGEISLIWHGNGSRLCSYVNDILGPALIGMDPFRVVEFHKRADQSFKFGRHSLAAIAGVEMALLDMQGKILDQPVYNLLGGLTRDRVELSMSIHMQSIEDSLAQARAFADQGFSTVKVKVGLDPEHDIELVRLLRREFKALKIRVDANMGWSQAKVALGHIRRMAGSDILSVEQPLPDDDLDGMAYLREHSEVPIMADESVWGLRDAWRVISARAADLINIYVAESGGLLPARDIATMASMAGVGVCIGSMPELGIGTAAQAHLAVSLPTLDHPSDVTGYLYQADDVVTTPPPIADGYALVPPGPGLGVELDEEKLERYRVPVRA